MKRKVDTTGGLTIFFRQDCSRLGKRVNGNLDSGDSDLAQITLAVRNRVLGDSRTIVLMAQTRHGRNTGKKTMLPAWCEMAAVHRQQNDSCFMNLRLCGWANAAPAGRIRRSCSLTPVTPSGGRTASGE